MTTDTAEIDGLRALLLESHALDAVQRRLDALDILGVFGIRQSETAHSAFWGWLLDPSGSHGMGARFLRSFLRYVTAQVDVEDRPTQELGLLEVESADLSGSRVATEATPMWMKGVERPPDRGPGRTGDQVASRRFDIQVDIPWGRSQALVVVEMKLKAREGADQTSDYDWAIDVALDELDYERCLKVFLDLKGQKPQCESFLPVSLGKAAGAVLGPALASGADLLSPEVSALLRNYLRSVELADPAEDAVPDGFLERHLDALAYLRDYLAWSADLRNLVDRGLVPDGATLTFHDRKADPVRSARLQAGPGRVARVVVEGAEAAGALSLNQAAKVAGRPGHPYNAWFHWRSEGRVLAGLRAQVQRQHGEADAYCAAITNGRRPAVAHVIELAEREHLPPRGATNRADARRPPRRDGGRRGSSQLELMAARGLLRPGQMLHFRKADDRGAHVEIDEAGAVWLAVGDARHASPSRAATDLAGGIACNGYTSLWFDDTDGVRRRLDVLRQRLSDKQPD